MTTRKRAQLISALGDKEFRDAYVEANIETGVAFQIKANRLARKLTQEQLGEIAGMKQTAISRLETSGGGLPKLDTLVRLASAFDAAVIVRFVGFSELVDWTTTLGDRDLSVPAFSYDAGLSGSIGRSNVTYLPNLRSDQPDATGSEESTSSHNFQARAII